MPRTTSRAWKCGTVRVLDPHGQRPLDVKVCRVGRNTFDGYVDRLDFNVRKERFGWTASVFRRGIANADQAFLGTIDGDTLLGAITEVVRNFR